MFGVGIALLTSLAWSISSILLKLVAGKIDSLSINTLRTLVGSIILFTFIFFSGRFEVFFHLPLQSFIYVILSGLLAMGMGDTIYIKSIALLDISIAFPLSQCSFILLAVLSAVIFLGEPFTWIMAVGAIFITTGIYLMTSSGGQRGNPSGKKRIDPKGLLFILVAILAWTGATILLKIGVIGVDPFIAAGLRISASAIVLLFVIGTRKGKGTTTLKQFGWKYFALVAAAGLLTYGVAAVGYVTAIQWIGAGKTVLLTAIAPLFALPFSILILGEKPRRFTIIGVIISVVGVWLVVV
jgi:drug/metabolite transporter, DME family